MAWQETLTQSLGSVVTVIIWLILLAGVALVGYIIWLYTRYNVTYVIREIHGDRSVTSIDRARILKIKGQPMRWHLWTRREYIPAPPDEALDVTKKGKKFVEAYYTEHGEYVYIKDELHKKGSTVKYDETIGSLHPLKPTHKLFYLQQLKEAARYEKKTWQDVAVSALPVIGIILILVIFMVFFDSAVAPTISFGKATAGGVSDLVDASTRLAEACEGIQGVQRVTVT